jgi:dTMP kinase
VRERGRFITLEGGEGAGKSTQAARLADWLDWLGGQGVDVLLTREPGGSERAEVLRRILVEGHVAPFGADAEAIFFAVARADHVREKIVPALSAGTWVVCDRFLDSTWAYQGSAGADLGLLKKLDRVAVGENRPDLTLILDLRPQLGLLRLSDRGARFDRFEADDLEVHEARRQAFLGIAEREPRRCVVIDAAAEPEEVARRIEVAVRDRLGAALTGVA